MIYMYKKIKIKINGNSMVIQRDQIAIKKINVNHL